MLNNEYVCEFEARMKPFSEMQITSDLTQMHAGRMHADPEETLEYI